MNGSGNVDRGAARSEWQSALAGSGMLKVLGRFDARVAGTLPLGIAVEGSDIDILCHAIDPNVVADSLWLHRAGLEELSLHRWIARRRPLVASFTFAGWPIEVFASPVPVDEQEGWRHFEVEGRLLRLGGARFRERILDLRRAGLKTEPAFAHALKLNGNPYELLWKLSIQPDSALCSVLVDTGF